MISHGKEIKVFTGNANPALAQGICDCLNISMGDAVCTHFADGECSVSVYEPVRGADVFLVQSTCGPVNDNLMELLVMIDAMRRASAGRITAVIPYFGYARQDRKAKSRDPISAKLVANLITEAGYRASSISPWTIWPAGRCSPTTIKSASTWPAASTWSYPRTWAAWPVPGALP